MGLFDAIEVMIEVVEAADEVPNKKEVWLESDLYILFELSIFNEFDLS